MSFVGFSFYRPPTATNVFINNLSEILKQHEGSEVILMGDFNLNLLDKAHRKKLKDIAKTYKMIMINKPTRITK